MGYPDDYIAAKDIDWFCVINGYYVYVASAGGALPEAINDRDKLRTLQRNVFMAPDKFADEDIDVNMQFLNARFGNQPNAQQQISNYLVSFKAMARKGFIFFDRTNLSDSQDNAYYVVCEPRNPIQIQGIADLVRCKIEDQELLTISSTKIQLLEILSHHQL